MSTKSEISSSITSRLSLGFLCWLGGAVHTANLPEMNFWDGLIWLYYVGRAIAKVAIQ